MTFHTLADRFEATANSIYNRFSPSGDQYIVIKPNTKNETPYSLNEFKRQVGNAQIPSGTGVFTSNSTVKDDSRLFPWISTIRDAVRVSKFLTSDRGVLFLAKQQLLQTGNTFAETRLYNFATPFITTLPGVGTGVARHLGRPILSNLAKSPTRVSRGGLQEETLKLFNAVPSGNPLVRLGQQALNSATSPFKALFSKPQQTSYFSDDPKKPSPKEFYLRPEDNVFYRYRSANGSGPVPTGPYTNIILDIKWLNERYQLGRNNPQFGPLLFPVQPLTERGNIKIFSNPNRQETKKKKKQSNAVSDQTVSTPSFISQYLKYGEQLVESGSKKTFKNLESTLNTNGYFDGYKLNVQDLGKDIDNKEIIENAVKSTIPNVTDPFNRYDVKRATNAPAVPSLYTDIIGEPNSRSNLYPENTKPDIINFYFKTSERDAEPVYFRAFLSSLKESVKPEFSEQRYLGRIERFVTYGGAKRSTSLQFNVVAFSSAEIQNMWKRINYLTSLAFPRGYTDSGFLIPPLFRITIGGIYENQPCYIETLDYDFLDDSITFDTEEGVSQVANVNMSLVLLEKTSKFHNSPFYAITEGN